MRQCYQESSRATGVGSYWGMVSSNLMTWVLAACQGLLSRHQGDGELWPERRARPYWPYRLTLCPEDHLLRVTMGLDDPTTGRQDRDLSPGCVLGPWNRGLELWMGRSRLTVQLPHWVWDWGPGSCASAKKLPPPSPPLLPAATPCPPSLFRDVCWQGPISRVTRSQDTVICQVGWWTLGVRHPRWLPGAPSCCLRGQPRREHWEPLKQEQVLPAALLGGSISEQEGGGGTALLRIEGKRGLPTSPNRLWGCPGYHQGRGRAECPRTSLLGGPKEITEHIFTWIQ